MVTNNGDCTFSMTLMLIVTLYRVRRLCVHFFHALWTVSFFTNNRTERAVYKHTQVTNKSKIFF